MSSILADSQYTLDQIKGIESNGIIKELHSDIIEKINKLARRVGAPSYQKTPVFKRHHNQKKIKKSNISNEDWEAIRNFKTTKLEKNVEGLEAKLDKIRSNLNKLTDKNYSEILENTISVIKDIIQENDNDALEKVGKQIFEIGCLNKYWAALYAKLYKDLIENYSIMRDICVKNFNSFEDIFTNINYIDAQENYNLFCEYNKQNEKRRALSEFFIVCCNNGIVDKEKMMTIVFNFFNIIDTNKEDETKKELIEEIVTNLSIILSIGCQSFKSLDNFDEIENMVDFYCNINKKKYAGISQKVIFKFMDIQESIED